MNEILPILILSTTAIFLAAVYVRSLGLGRLRFCAVCVTVSLTWLSLLVARLLGYAVNQTLMGILMGESVIGLYYLIEKRAPVAWQIFRWPYIITMTVVVCLVAGVRSGAGLAVVLLIAMWTIWGAAFAWREYPFIKKITQQLIACCRDW